MKEEIAKGAYATCHRCVHKISRVEHAVKVFVLFLTMLNFQHFRTLNKVTRLDQSFCIKWIFYIVERFQNKNPLGLYLLTLAFHWSLVCTYIPDFLLCYKMRFLYLLYVHVKLISFWLFSDRYKRVTRGVEWWSWYSFTP